MDDYIKYNMIPCKMIDAIKAAYPTPQEGRRALDAFNKPGAIVVYDPSVWGEQGIFVFHGEEVSGN
jgi:hypothetical protein